MNEKIRQAIMKCVMAVTISKREEGYSLAAKDGGAIHYYTDRAGNITHVRIRMKHPGIEEGHKDKKWIRPLKPDSKGNWTELEAPEFADGAPLYRLHELCDKSREAELVIVTEGEYCADLIAQRGILATTSGGAQTANSADWKPLEKRTVLIWPDSDKPGYDYARAVAAKLEGQASRVEFIDVAALNLPHKGDVVDWAKAFFEQHKRKATDMDILTLPYVKELPEYVGDTDVEEAITKPVTPNPGVIKNAYETNAPKGGSDSLDPPVNQSDDEIIKWLATLKPLEYERVRVAQAKAMNCRPAVLDALIKAVRNEGNESERLPFVEVDPHPEAIDPAQLLDEVSDTIRQFIVLGPDQADAAALWCALTWFIDVVEVAPLAIINAPEKACGKTQLLTVLGRMAYRPLPASNASASALFRAVEAWKPTILIDEADTFFRDNIDLHGLVNAGYLRDGFVLRSEAVGDSFEPRMFSVFSAKALAGIALEKHLPDATMSRGVVFNLRRKLSHESVNRLRHADRDLFAGIAEKLARFAADYSQQVRQARPILPDALSDRDQDNWDSLLAIASCAGDTWLERATSAALKLSGASEKTQSTGNELLADIQHIFESKCIEKISTVNLIEALCEDEEGAWATYNRGKPLNPRQVKKRLEAYGIASKTIRFGAYETAKGFELKQFADSFERYLFTPLNLKSQSNKPLEANSSKGFDVTSIKSQNGIGNIEVTPKAAPLLTCDRVTAKTPIFEGGTTLLKKSESHLRI